MWADGTHSVQVTRHSGHDNINRFRKNIGYASRQTDDYIEQSSGDFRYSSGRHMWVRYKSTAAGRCLVYTSRHRVTPGGARNWMRGVFCITTMIELMATVIFSAGRLFVVAEVHYKKSNNNFVYVNAKNSWIRCSWKEKKRNCTYFLYKVTVNGIYSYLQNSVRYLKVRANKHLRSCMTTHWGLANIPWRRWE